MAGVTQRTNVMFVPVTRSAAGGAATEYPITLGSTQVKFILRRVKIKRVAGAAANFTPFITNATGSASTSINKVYVGGATAVGTLFDQSPNAYDVSDVGGKVYLTFGWDAGADSTADYELAFEILA